jgi:mRNA interferase HigB
MRVFNLSTLKRFWSKHPNAKIPLTAWYKLVDHADWKNHDSVKKQFGKARFVKDKIIFNICNNEFRLIVKVDYTFKAVFIKFLGTHKQYDKINVNEL